MPVRLALNCLLLCISPALLAQPSDEDPLAAIFKGLQAERDTLGRYRFLQAQKRATNAPEVENFINQMLANDLAEMARYRDAESLYSPASGSRQNVLPDGVAAPALEAILRLSRDRRVVMLNEAHTVPRTRWLTWMLLKPMREAGFTHLALETLSVADDGKPLDTALLQRGYPNRDTGYYTREPVFAEIIRDAIRLGYTLIAYEHRGSNGGQQARETGQASALAEALKQNPDARLIVHAGHGHINEDSSNFTGKVKTMADEFKRMTGIDPLTVEQTRLWDRPDMRNNHPAYAAGLELWRRQHADSDPNVPFLVMQSPEKAWSLQPSSFDISVFAAPWNEAQHWRELDGLRRRRDIADAACTHYPCLVEARYAAEGDDAIPADRQLLDQAGPVQLWLRDGCYRITHLHHGTDANPDPRHVCFGPEAETPSSQHHR